MSETRSIGSQCESNKSTAVQTKRITKEELRYYTKIVEKEKQILLSFAKATKEYPVLRQPHYTINLAPYQTKFRKNFGTRKKRKSKKHSSHKTKGKTSVELEHDQENTGHYVSKIVVDDATHCLKLRVKSCKKGQEVKENTAERTRSRKAKQPRRFNRELETLTEHINSDGVENPKVESNDARNKTINDKNDKNNNIITANPLKPTSVKDKVDKTGCLLAKNKSRDIFSSPGSSPLPTMTSELTPNLPPALSVEETANGETMTPDGQATSDEDSNYHSPNEDSDDNQSVCSEEFFIVETKEHNLSDGKKESCIKEVKETDINLKDEVKKRLKANLIRKASDSEHETDDTLGRESIQERNTRESKVLPQVVSVHFYDPQTHSQRIVGADASISFPRIPIAQDTSIVPYPKLPSNIQPYPQHVLHKSPGVTSKTPSPANLSHATLPGIPPINYPHSSYHPNTTAINKKYPAYQTSGIPPNAKESVLPPDIGSSIPEGVINHHHNEIPIASVSTSLPAETPTSSIPTRGVVPPIASVSKSLPSETRSIMTSNPNATTSVMSNKPELVNREITPTEASGPKAMENSTETVTQSKKRKRFIFGSHEPPRKKVISSLLTPLCEREATRLADGIHEINMQYFPLRSLAQKAANRVSGDTDDILKLIDQKIQLKTKIQDVEKARNLLKDIYDMVLKSKEIEDIQNFELVSHNFGVRNILNHLSLVDLYFGELGSELESKI